MQGPETDATVGLLADLMSNPLLGGGTIVGTVVGILIVGLKIYNVLRKDQSTADAITNSFATQTQVIDMLKGEITRLSDEVQKLRSDVAALSDSRRKLADDNVKLQRELDDCNRRQNV